MAKVNAPREIKVWWHSKCSGFRVFVLCSSLILWVVGCLPAAVPNSYPTTPTIIVDTPLPEQGIRGTVSYGTGPVDENGTAVSPGHAGGVRVFVLDTGTKQLITETRSSVAADSFGMYEIKLPPGRYDVCVHTTRDICIPGVVVTANNYSIVDIEIPES